MKIAIRTAEKDKPEQLAVYLGHPIVRRPAKEMCETHGVKDCKQCGGENEKNNPGFDVSSPARDELGGGGCFSGLCPES